jgi:hypothetical protein
MKQIIFCLTIILFIAACSTQHAMVKVSNTQESTVEDSLEYDLETFDGRFEAWYELHNIPAKYRSQAYYEGWNRQYVSAWNYNAVNGRNKSFFEPIIGYEYNVDYGFELNHELFHYFQYVENVLKIQIMPGGPRAGLF